MNSISPLSGIPPSGSSTSDSAGRGKYNNPQQGHVFKAIVLEAKGANTFILDIGGSKIPAQTKAPLSIGETLKLMVTNTSPRIELRVLSDSKNLFAGKAITLLGDKIDLQALLSTIRTITPSPLENINTVSKLTLESFFSFNQDNLGKKDSGEILKNLIDRLGISFEALLAKGDKATAQNTLKSALLDLAQVFKSADILSERTNSLLNTLELYQLAQLSLDKENIYIFPLPIPFLEKGYLLVENHSENAKNSQEGEDRFSLHLTLQGLGNLRVDILKNEEGIYIRFVSDSEKKLDFIKIFKDDLLLNMINTNILGVSFSLETVDPAADLLKRLFPEGESIVNTKV